MTPSFTIRDARPTDAEEIAVLGKSVNISTYGKFVGEEAIKVWLEGKYTVEKVKGDIGDEGKDFVVATTTTTSTAEKEAPGEEQIIGFAVLARGFTYPCLEQLEDIIELERIYIYPEFHGRGVGKALMGELERRAKMEGRKNIWLGCYEHNEVARAVYAKRGYVKCGERVHIVGGREHLDGVMVKRL